MTRRLARWSSIPVEWPSCTSVLRVGPKPVEAVRDFAMRSCHLRLLVDLGGEAGRAESPLRIMQIAASARYLGFQLLAVGMDRRRRPSDKVSNRVAAVLGRVPGPASAPLRGLWLQCPRTLGHLAAAMRGTPSLAAVVALSGPLFSSPLCRGVGRVLTPPTEGGDTDDGGRVQRSRCSMRCMPLCRATAVADDVPLA